MPNNKESYKQFTELLFQKWERQKQCNHRFGETIESLHGFENVCSKCGYTKRVKIENQNSRQPKKDLDRFYLVLFPKMQIFKGFCG
jgi:hypothetical protein